MATLITHRKARFDYEILETFEAGIELFGFEVKSLRRGEGAIAAAHATVRGGEAFLLNMHVPPYQPANAPNDYDPYHNRKLLLNKKELGELAGFERKKGLTIVPLSLYNKGRKIKVELAVVRGKKKHDKREALKERGAKREIERTLKNAY